MGILQNYKGSPAKQYFLTNNFVSGLNLTDADDVSPDSSFRELLNVELGSQGVLKNRKGFEYFYVFNEILDIAAVAIPSGTIRLAKIVINTSNVMYKMDEYGKALILHADSLCVHGDNIEGVQAIEAIKELIG